VTSRSTQIIVAALLSLLFSMQAFGYTVPVHSQLPAEAGCKMPAGMADEHCGMIASPSSEHDHCADTDNSCQMDSECSMSHCSIGIALTMDSAEIALWSQSVVASLYIHSLPVAPSSSLYKPPKA